VQFFEKKRRKTYFFGKADEDVCWEQWTLDVTLAQPRTETGTLTLYYMGKTIANGLSRCPKSPSCHDQIP
jgi:3-methyladenine DNA glycosylase AlkD